MSSTGQHYTAAGDALGASTPPAKGENELFTQSWFPITFSDSVRQGEIKGFDFLDGRVIVVRDEGGLA